MKLTLYSLRTSKKTPKSSTSVSLSFIAALWRRCEPGTASVAGVPESQRAKIAVPDFYTNIIMAEYLCEEESDSCAKLEHNNSSKTVSLTAPKLSEADGYFRATALPLTNVHVYSLAPTKEAKAITKHSFCLDEMCCCDSRIYQSPGINTAESASRHSFCGWEHRTLHVSSSTHIVIAQRSDQSLGLSKSTSSNKSKYSSFHIPVSKRTTYSTKSQVRSYIYSEYSKSIQYEFEHHTEGTASLHIDKYRKTITYPKMEQKSLMGNGPATAVEMTLWSGRCVQSSVVIKPKLFVLGKAPDTLHTRPITCRKSYPDGPSLYSVAESRVKPTKFRLSNLNNTIPQHHNQQCSHWDGSNQFTVQHMEYSDRTEPRHNPVSIVGGFSSQQQAEQSSIRQSQEHDYAGAEEDNDAQLSMTWIAQPVPESFLVSSVTYTAPSSKSRQKMVSKTHKNSNTGFKGAVNVNSLRSTSRGPGAALLNMSGQRPLSSRTAGGDRLSYSFQLSTQSMPLIKSDNSKLPTKTNKLGHLLKRRNKKSSIWRPHTDDTTAFMSTHGVY